MSILKMTCPHCNFNYVLPEKRVPSGELTLTCPSCHQTYTYTKPEPVASLKRQAGKGRFLEPDISTDTGQKTPKVENRPFYRYPSEPGPATLPGEPEKVQESSTVSIPVASESESRHSTGLEAPGVPEQLGPVQAFTETPVAEEGHSLGWEPAGIPPEEPDMVQASTEKISEAPAVEKRPSLGWQPVSPSEEPQPVETPAVEESVIVRSEPEKLEEPKQVQSPAEPISKASPAAQKPSPVPKPTKKVVRKPVAAARQGARTKWVIAVALGCAVTIVVSIAVYKPAVVARVKDAYGIWSVKIKEDVSSLVNKKQEPKPVITEPAQPSVATPSEPVIMRPSNFHEVAGTWTGTLRSDRRGTRWTFSFNPANYNVSIKNESGLWVKGTAVFHWDKGSLIGDTLRAAPNWNSLDIDIIKSSVSEYAGKVSLGAFSRNENALKLCMSRPGKMIEPTETDSTGEIQCFDLKKKGSDN